MRIVLLGGTGFVGREIVRHLGRLKSSGELQVIVTGRRAASASTLRQLAPSLDASSVSLDAVVGTGLGDIVRQADRVVNLVGILHETGAQVTFDKVHGEFASWVSDELGSRDGAHLVHVSAIGADANSKSKYARSKAEGERQALRLCERGHVSVLRPSIVFGPEDAFFNRFDEMARWLPFLPVIGGGGTKMQPIHVGDVARATVRALQLPDDSNEERLENGGVYQLGGASILTFAQLMQLTLKAGERSRVLLPIPYALASLQGALFEGIHRMVPSVAPQLTRDQVVLLQQDNIVERGAKTVAQLGIDDARACNIDTVDYLVSSGARNVSNVRR